VIPDPSDKPTMTVEEVALVLGISRASAYQAVRTGEVPSVRIGHRIVIPTAAVRRILEVDGDTRPLATPRPA
jgi:excisionase family DNA binding protein